MASWRRATQAGNRAVGWWEHTVLRWYAHKDTGLWGSNGLVTNGCAGGEANYDSKTGNYDDEPMFLIFNGVAFAARLAFDEHEQHAPPTLEFEVKLVLNASWGFVPMQGMRVHMDGALNRLAISAASCAGPYGGNWTMQFSLLSLDATTGELVWAKWYPTGVHASHFMHCVQAYIACKQAYIACKHILRACKRTGTHKGASCAVHAYSHHSMRMRCCC